MALPPLTFLNLFCYAVAAQLISVMITIVTTAPAIDVGFAQEEQQQQQQQPGGQEAQSPIACNVDNSTQYCADGTVCQRMVGKCTPAACYGQLTNPCPLGTHCVVIPIDTSNDVGVPGNIGTVDGIGQCEAQPCDDAAGGGDGADSDETCPDGFQCLESKCTWIKGLQIGSTESDDPLNQAG